MGVEYNEIYHTSMQENQETRPNLGFGLPVTNAIQPYVVLGSLMSNSIYTIRDLKLNDVKGPKPPYTLPSIDLSNSRPTISGFQLIRRLRRSYNSLTIGHVMV